MSKGCRARLVLFFSSDEKNLVKLRKRKDTVHITPPDMLRNTIKQKEANTTRTSSPTCKLVGKDIALSRNPSNPPLLEVSKSTANFLHQQSNRPTRFPVLQNLLAKHKGLGITLKLHLGPSFPASKICRLRQSAHLSNQRVYSSKSFHMSYRGNCENFKLR